MAEADDRDVEDPSDDEPVQADDRVGDLPDEETVQAVVQRRYGLAALAWTIGAVLVALQSVLDAFVGPVAADLAPGSLILHGATTASFAGAVLAAWAAMRLWGYRIRTMESRLDRYRWRRRHRAVRIALVVLFAFMVGMVFWYIEAPIVALIAVALGFLVLLGIAYLRWDRLDERGQELVVLGAGLVGLHPISMILLEAFGPIATAGGYGLVAAGLLRPVLDLDEDDEEAGDAEARPADQAEPSR